MNDQAPNDTVSWSRLVMAAWIVIAPFAGSVASAQPAEPTPIHAIAQRTPLPGTGGDAPAPTLPGEIKLSYGPFGEVTIYQPAGLATSVALFISGDGGWNLGVVNMARHLMGMGAVVVGIDIRRYLKSVNTAGAACRNFAVDFEGLAHAVQWRLDLQTYLPPVLIGYSSGATLAYATAVQSPKGTFAGALSLGFCPDLAVTQSLCKGSGLAYATHAAKVPMPAPVTGVLFAPVPANVTPWIAFQGDIDQVCDVQKTRQFVAQSGAAELVWLPKVGHGFSVERNWLPQFKASYSRMAQSGASSAVVPSEVRDLPLVEVPATAAPAPSLKSVFAIVLTGDGGWAGLDQELAAGLAASGIPSVGFNTLKYFWQPRTPELAARDLARVIEHYRTAWQRPDVLLIGYSFGADVLPFLFTRLPDQTRAAVRSVNLLGPGESASFEIRVADWIPGRTGSGWLVQPEVKRMTGASVLCLYGTDERDSPCPRLAGDHVKAVTIGGGHHFGGDYAALVRQIVDHARR